MNTLSKKIIALTYIIFMLVIFLTPIKLILAQQSDCLSPNVYTSDGRCIKPMNPYVLLAPLPCPDNDVNCTVENGKSVLNSFKFNPNINTLGAYLNLIIKIIIGLSAVLAVVMIVIGGMEYMTSELVSSKEAGKDRIRDAIFGLVLALGAYTLLFTINPDLLSTNINIPEALRVVTVNAPDGGDVSEGINKPAVCGTGSTTTDPARGFCMSGTPANPQPSAGVSAMTNVLKAGSTIMQIDISNRIISFRVKDANGTVRTFNTNALGIGVNGLADEGKGQSGDMKTPKGKWSITDIRTSSDQSQRIANQVGQSMGGVALMLNVGSRGIAIHGNSGNKPGSSAGCVIMSNDDLFAIIPYVKSGIPVNIW